MLLLSVLVYYYLTPNTVNCNEQMYGRTLLLYLYSVSHDQTGVATVLNDYYVTVTKSIGEPDLLDVNEDIEAGAPNWGGGSGGLNPP